MTLAPDIDMPNRRIGCAVLLAALAATVLGGCDNRPKTTPTPIASAVPARSGSAAIDPGLVLPYERKLDADIYRLWGAKGAARLSAFKKAAAETVAKNPTCGRVSYVDLADEAHGTRFPSHPVMIVDCDPIQRFFVSESDIGKETLSQTQKGQAFTRVGVTKICLNSIRSKLSYPSSMDLSPLSVSADQGVGTGNWGVSFEFKAKNALGNEMPQTARCIITPDGDVEANIENR